MEEAPFRAHAPLPRKVRSPFAPQSVYNSSFYDILYSKMRGFENVNEVKCNKEPEIRGAI